MGLSNFNIDEYVESRLLGLDCEKLTLEQIDDLLNKKDTFARNVRNLLTHFEKDDYLERFSFKTDIFKYFPISSFNEVEIGLFLDHIFNLKNNDRMIGNKLISNINKISIDNKDSSINDKWRKFDFFYINKPEASYFPEKLNYYKYMNREIIRRRPQNVKEMISNMRCQIKELEIENNSSNLQFAIDLVLDAILQMINYWVITIPDLQESIKIQIATKIESYLIDFESALNQNFFKKRCDVLFDEAIAIFISILEQRNNFGEYISVIELLEEEENEDSAFFGPVPNVYKVDKCSDIPIERHKEIILEGMTIDEYGDKLNKTKETIELFARYGGRIANHKNLLDIKVYFREIYLSNSKYKRKASTIIRKFLKKYKESGKADSYEKASEYLFLREKISRGYYRETSSLQLYYLKNKLQKKLYHILMDTMLCYDFLTTLMYLEQLFEEITPLCFSGIDDIFEQHNMQRIFLKSIP